MIRGLTIAIACSVACAYGRLGASDDSAPKAIVRALPGSDGRLLAWTVGDKDFGAVQPARVLLSKAAPAGMPAIGFTHSGYSAEDPDGKNAILTFTVELGIAPVSMDDKTMLASKGVKFGDELSVQNPPFTMVDISLAANPEEEKRLRTQLQLPRKIGEPSGKQPFSMRWKGVPGATLYKWLTDQNDGLRVIFTGDKGQSAGVPVAWLLSRTYAIDLAKLEKWWTSNAGMKSIYAWKGGVEVLAQNLIAANVLQINGAAGTIEGAEPEFRLLCRKIKSAATELPNGALQITKDNFKTLATEGRIQTYSIVSSADALPAMSPGRKLLDFPAQIKDLSGASTGLDALKNDSD